MATLNTHFQRALAPDSALHGTSGAGRIRTPDFWFWRPAFYQLNYCPGGCQF